MVEKVYSVRYKAEGGVQLREELRGIGQSAEQAGAQMERGIARGSAGWQNVGFQVQDFAVQVAGGTDASRALAQQLPQLLSGFGLLGVAAGTAAAVLFPLAGYLFDVGEGADATAEKLDGLAKKIDELKEANANFSSEGIDRLIEKYGELDAKVLLLIERQRQLKEEEALTQARSLASGLGGDLDPLIRSLEGYERTLELIAEATARGEEVRQDRLIRLQDELNERFGVTVQQAQAIRDALAEVNVGSSVIGAANALSALNGLLEGSVFYTVDLRNEFQEAEDQLRQLNAEGGGIGGWLGAAIEWAAGLASNLRDGAAAAAAIRSGVVPASSVGGGRGSSIGGPALDPYGFRDQLERDRRIRGAITPPRSSGGGANPNAEDERERARLIEATRTEAERYAAEVENLNRLLRESDIDADLHARAIEAVRAKYEEAASEGLTFKDAIIDISQSLVDAARSGQNLGDTLGQVFTDIAADLAATQLQRLLTSAFSPLLGRLGLEVASPILSAFSASSGVRAVQSVSGATAQSAGSRKVAVNVIGGGLAREDVDVSETTGPGGETQIDIVLKKKMQGMLASGQLDGAMRAAYGLRRVAG